MFSQPLPGRTAAQNAPGEAARPASLAGGFLMARVPKPWSRSDRGEWFVDDVVKVPEAAARPWT